MIQQMQADPMDESVVAAKNKLDGAISFDLMQNTKIFAVGAGGANGIYENLARVGLGALTVIDYDVVDSSNLVTQGWKRQQIGMPKVLALTENLQEATPWPPMCSLVPLQRDFLQMSDMELEQLAHDASLMMFMCDDFHAQARGNRLALKLKKSAVFAIMYEKARCCEITFSIPGVTPACHRCATSPRYRAYLEEGFVNDIGSHGSMIIQTSFLNDLIGLITLAIIHRDTVGLEFSNWFGNKWDRNLVQIRLSDHFESELFKKVYTDPRTRQFDSIWLRVTPDDAASGKPCPDCGGIGDLRHAEVAHTAVPR